MSNYKEFQYLPRFVSTFGDTLDNLLGDNKILEFGVFGTLRFKHYRKLQDNNNNTFREPLSDSAIIQNWSAFFKILNKKVMKSQYKNKNRKRIEIPTLAILEDHSHSIYRSHIHFIMLKPKSISYSAFADIIKTTWAKTYFGTIGTSANRMFDLQRVYNRNIIPYLFTEKDYFTPSAIHCTSQQRVCLFNSL